MAFLFKVFSWSERLKDTQKSAEIVNKTFQQELKNVQSRLEEENDELQILVDMIYDSSFPETQKFLKDPSKDRLQSHTETISSLLFGLAAQGVAVAPLILTHFQKYGYEAIADTLIKLLELVRPLLASKDAPEFTSDDILDAIDVQWHSSVRSSPAFGSLRGSIPPSPLQSPRGSFSALSPRGSFSSPRNSFSMHYAKVVGSPGVQIPSEIISPRRTQSYCISPPSSLPGAGWDGAGSTPPRRSFSSRMPSSDGNLSLPYGERLQPLAEQDEENNHGSARFRKHHDSSIMASLLQIEDDKDSALRLNSESELKQSLDANIPRRSLPLEVSRDSGLKSVGGTQAVDKLDTHDVPCVKSTSVPIPKVDKSGGEDNGDNGVRGAKTFGAPNRVFYDSSTTALDQGNVMRIVNSSHAKEVDEETPEVLVPSSLTRSSGRVQKLVKSWTSSGLVLEGAPGLLNEKNFESEAGIHSEKVPLPDQVPTPKSTQVQQLTEELSSPVQNTTQVKQDSSFSAKKTESKHIEVESCMSNVRVSDNAQIDMGKADENMRKVVLEVIGGNNLSVDCVEGDIANHEHHPSTLPPFSFDASDKLFASIAIKDKEESSKLLLDPTEGSIPGVGNLSEGEVESREHESLDLRQGQENVEAMTDILDSSSALDSEDSDDDNSRNSSSSSSSSQSSSSSSSSTSDDESTSISSKSSEKGESLSNSDYDTDDERCMISLRQQGTEEVPQSVPVEDSLEGGTVLSHAQDEETTLPLGNVSSEFCSTIDVDTHEVPGTEETGSVPCDNNPELDLEPGAELLTPSYNLMTFDSDEDRSSDLSIESEDNSIPDEMSENEVITEPASHDGLHMILVNYITGSRPISPKELPPLTNTTANGTSLPSSSSQNYQEDLVAGNVMKVVASSAIDGSTDAGVHSHDALELKLSDRSPSEKMEKTEASVVTDSVILLSDDRDLERNQEHVFADVSCHDSEVVVTDCEGGLIGALAQNEMEMDFPTKNCEPQSIEDDSLASVPSGEEVHDRDFLVREDLVTGGSDVKELDAAGIETSEISTGIEEGHTPGGHPNEHITKTGEDEPYLVEGKNPRQQKDEEVSGYSMINSQEVSYGIKNKFADSVCNQQTDPANGCTMTFSTDAATNISLEGAAIQDSPRSKTSSEIDSVALPSYVQEEGDNDTRYISEESRFARSREPLPDTALEQAVRVDHTKSVSEGSENDVHLLQTEGHKHDISTSASPESSADADQTSEIFALKSLSVSNEQSEVHKCRSHLIENAEDDRFNVIVEPVNVHCIEAVADKGGFEGFGGSQESEQEVAGPCERDVSEVSRDPHGSYLTKSEIPSSLQSEKHTTDAAEHVSTQWTSPDSKDTLAQSDNYDPLSLNEGEVSPIVQADETHHRENEGHNLAQADKTNSNSVQYTGEVGNIDSSGGDLKRCTESLLGVHHEEIFFLGDDVSEQSLVGSRSSRRSSFEQDDSLRDVNVQQTGYFKVKGGIEVTLPVKATEKESGGESCVLKSLEASDAGNLTGSLISGSYDTELSPRVDGDQQSPLSEYLERNKVTSEEHREPELIQRESLKSISADLMVTTPAFQSDRHLQPVGEVPHMICETPQSSTQEEEKVDFTPHSVFTLLSEPEELFLAEDKGAELAVIECTAPSNSHEEKNSSLKHDRNKESEGEVNKTSDSETKDALDGTESDGGNNPFTERGDYTGVIDSEPALNPVKTETSPSSLKVNDVEQDENFCRVAKDTGATTATSGNENDWVFTLPCQRPVDSRKLLSEENFDAPGSSMFVQGNFKQPLTFVSSNNSLSSDIVSVEDCKEVTHSEEIEGQGDKSFTECGAASQTSQQINDVSEHPVNHVSTRRDYGGEERWDEKRPLKLSNNTIVISERLEWDTLETTYKTSKLSLGGHESVANRGEQPLNSVSLPKEQEMSIKVVEVEKSSKPHFENERTGETCKQVNGNQNTRLLDAFVSTPADESERVYQNEVQQKRTGDDIFVWPSELSKEEKTQMTSYALGRNTDCDEKEVLAGSFIGSLYNLTIIDSRGDPVSAIPVPTTIPSPVKVNSSRTIANLSHSDTMEKHAVFQDDRSYLSGDEKEAESPTRNDSDFDEAAVMSPVHSNTTKKTSFVSNASSLRDSIICNSSSSESSFQTEKRVRQIRRFKFVRTLCCSCCSKPSTL